MSTIGARIHEARAVTIELEIAIAAGAERVWQAMTGEIDRWWLPDFRVTGAPKAVVFEAEVGGRVYEDMGGGAGLEWFRVISLTPHQSLHLAGQICPPFGGPATAMLYVIFEAMDATHTLLKITNAMVGNVSDGAISEIHSGWRMLFEKGLKEYVETVS